MWSEVKAMGTIIMFFLPLLARALITSSVWGPSHGNGPTYIQQVGGERESKSNVDAVQSPYHPFPNFTKL